MVNEGFIFPQASRNGARKVFFPGQPPASLRHAQEERGAGVELEAPAGFTIVSWDRNASCRRFFRLLWWDVATGIRKSGSRETETPLEELAVKDAINAIHKAQVRSRSGSKGIMPSAEISGT